MPIKAAISNNRIWPPQWVEAIVAALANGLGIPPPPKTGKETEKGTGQGKEKSRWGVPCPRRRDG